MAIISHLDMSSVCSNEVMTVKVKGVGIIFKPIPGSQSMTSTVYFENGTCKCSAEIISGTTYTVVNNSTNRGQISSGNYNLCITFVNMEGLFVVLIILTFLWDTSLVTTLGQ